MENASTFIGQPAAGAVAPALHAPRTGHSVLGRSSFKLQATKALRTAQVSFPFLLDWKFAWRRAYGKLTRTPFEPAYRALALFPESGDALCLDVGANRGQSTDAMLLMRKHARVIMFEPNDVIVEKLNAVYGRDDRIVIHNFGLGAENSEAELTMPIYRNWMFDGLASLQHEHAANWLRGRLFFFNERHLKLRKTRCPIRRLDDLNVAPFFISIYIQGYDLPMLQGAEQTLRRHEPVVLIGDADDRSIEFLKALGYQFYAFVGDKFYPQMRGAPYTLFMTASKAAQVRRHIELKPVASRGA